MLSSRDHELMVKLTNLMFDSPACSIFRDPVDPERDIVPTYFDVIKNPIDLGKIKKRVYENYYQNIDDWVKDINLVFDNAILFNGQYSVITNIAQCMKAKFEKKYHKLFIRPEEWNARINEIFSKLNIQMKLAPGILKREFEGKRFTGPMTPRELQKLADSASSLTDINEVLQMVQLLNAFGIKLDSKKDDVSVVLKNIPNDAQQALLTFVKDKFRLHHKHYPD